MLGLSGLRSPSIGRQGSNDIQDGVKLKIMRITKFEEFIEKSVPYFIIGLLLVILLVMGSCSNVKDGKIDSGKTQTIIIDGCEYIFIESGLKTVSNYAMTITHKGNCKNHKPCE